MDLLPTTTLIALSGLPGSGKTTIARLLARRLGALHLRIDSIEQAIRSSGGHAPDMGHAGYLVAYAVARDSLAVGVSVIADSVNPLPVTRAAWHEVGAQADVPVVDVELICSDAALHRRRVETRVSDVPGLSPPTWQAVATHDYVPWSARRLIVDTATLSAEGAADVIVRGLTARP